MMKRRISWEILLIVQLIAAAAVVQSYALCSPALRQQSLQKLGAGRGSPVVPVPRETPLVIEPLYDDPGVVSDEQLAAVLGRIQPRFRKRALTPNYVEHALRTWGYQATFLDKQMMPGAAMKDFLVDHGNFLASWGDKTPPLLQDRQNGVAIRWGQEDGASVHHDHWLACLTEAGVSLHEPVFTPGQRRREINDVLQEALRDFRVDEIEIEWSALAFGLWIAPQKSWITATQGREVSFDMIAERLITGPKKFGTCLGTHRVYSLMVLVRLDDDYDILSDPARERALDYLRTVRDLIAASQFPDGHWPANWMDGADALANPVSDTIVDRVTATGHHLEWLAIAPEELHPPRAAIRKAADWLIQTTAAQTRAEFSQRYTYFSHVGNALALWRKTHPAAFWQKWEAGHPPIDAAPETSVNATTKSGQPGQPGRD
jgi:hypothetical protein